MASDLIYYNAARTALAECARVDEVKDVRDKAEAMKKYAQLANDKQLMSYATEITLRAKRRLGEILTEMARTGERVKKLQGALPGTKRIGGKGKSHEGSKVVFPNGPTKKKTLEDLGINSSQSSKWMKLAAVPEKDFEAMVEDTKARASSTKPRVKRTAPRKNPVELEEAAARLVLDGGKTRKQAAAETGVGSEQVVKTAVAREEGKRAAEAQIDRAELSMTAQEKLDSTIRQHKHKLEMEFDARVREVAKNLLEETILPQYNKEIEDARSVIKARKSIMPRAVFKKILACLHPDRWPTGTEALQARYADAFSIVSGLEIVLCGEAEMPTPSDDFPRTYADLMGRRQKVSAARKKTKGVPKRA